MIRALLSVFVSGAAVMISELVAGRLVAPHFGQSIKTWTALTGVTLLGCTLGNALGAVLSRKSPRLVASIAFALGGLAIIAVPFVLPVLAPLGLLPAVVLAWLLPSVLLGCVTPSAAAAVVRPDRNGSDLSWLYALSMTGSLLGAGFGGLVLPFVIPADTLYFLLGAILFLFAPLAFTLPSPTLQPSNSPLQLNEPHHTPTPTHPSNSPLPLQLSNNYAFPILFLGYLGMAAEMAASKLVIPILGGNHVVWALIIVSFIGWMAAGGSLGGRIADRLPYLGTAVGSICFAALGISATLILETRLFTLPSMDALDVPIRLFLQIVLGFAPVAFSLGAANTALLKFATSRALADGDRAAPGLFYALSSAGSVAGTFITGLWCTGLIPGHVLMSVLASAALVVAFALARGHNDLRVLIGMVLAAVLAIATFAQRPIPHDIVVSGEVPLFSRESNYNVVNVTAEEGRLTVRTIWLDRIGHTTVHQDHPEILSSTYTSMIDSILKSLTATNGSSLSVFMIGGGGYALPIKWAMDKMPPKKVVVAEIDPVVKEAAFRFLKPARIDYPDGWSFPVGDGRSIARDLEKGGYDVVIGDTIADTAIPYHLVTAEFTAELKSLLKPQGVYLLHVLDVPNEMDLTGTLAATLHTSFAHVGALWYNGLNDKRQSIVLVATDDPAKMNLSAFAAMLKADRPASYPHTKLMDGHASALTDRFAPVERWVWRTITSSMETRATRLARQALDARNANDMPLCRKLAMQALAIDPDHVWAVEALADWLDENPTDSEALAQLRFAAERENPDAYAKRRLKRFGEEHEP